MDIVVPWPQGKSMYQLDERGVMFSMNELRQVVPELQRRIAALEASVQGLRIAVNYKPGERQAKKG